MPATATVLALLGPDNAGDVITQALTTATGRLDVAVYELGPAYAWALEEAAERCAVRLLLDAHGADGANPATRSRFRGGGVAVRELGAIGAAAHWKLILAGEGRLLVGSGNLIVRDAPRHAREAGGALAGTREWWLSVSGAPTLVTAARRAVDGAWALAAPAADRGAGDLVTAPAWAVGTPLPQVVPLAVELSARQLELATDARACAALLARHLARAAQRAWVTVPYVHAHARAVAPLVARLAARAAAGVDVRLLLGEPAANDAAAASPAELAAIGIETRVMDPTRTTVGHAKGLVADGTVVVGSANWSQGGLLGNREAAIAVADAAVADHYAAAFTRDWDASA